MDNKEDHKDNHEDNHKADHIGNKNCMSPTICTPQQFE